MIRRSALPKRSLQRRVLVIVCPIAVLVALALGWRMIAPEKKPQYLTAKVERGDLENAVLATGTLRAFKQVDVGAQVSGQLKSLKVRLGDKVRAGQWLAEIDPVIPHNALRQAEANVDHLVAQQHATSAQLTQAELALQRQKQLLPVEATSQHEFEVASAALGVQRATLSSLEAQIRAAKIQVDSSRANLSYTRIVAPIDGEVVAIVTQEGQTVIAQQQAPVILKLAQLDTMTIKARISEADVIRVHPGQPVYFTILGEPDRRYYSKLRAVEPAPPDYADSQTQSGHASDGASGSHAAVFYDASFEVPNPDHRLRISMTAQVGVLLDTARQALNMPVAALGERGKDGRYAVRVLGSGDEVSTRQVRVGLNNNVKVEVLEGLEPGERVVIGDDTAENDEPQGA